MCRYAGRMPYMAGSLGHASIPSWFVLICLDNIYYGCRPWIRLGLDCPWIVLLGLVNGHGCTSYMDCCFCSNALYALLGYSNARMPCLPYASGLPLPATTCPALASCMDIVWTCYGLDYILVAPPSTFLYPAASARLAGQRLALLHGHMPAALDLLALGFGCHAVCPGLTT